MASASWISTHRSSSITHCAGGSVELDPNQELDIDLQPARETPQSADTFKN